MYSSPAVVQIKTILVLFHKQVLDIINGQQFFLRFAIITIVAN